MHVIFFIQSLVFLLVVFCICWLSPKQGQLEGLGERSDGTLYNVL